MKKLAFLILLATLCGCSSDEPVLPDEQPSISDNLYLEFNQWVYSEMNRQYLWRDDLPDSLECNYDLAPRDFFKSLLSAKDRFSYFTSNPGYSRSATENLGFEYQLVKDTEGNEWMYVLYVTSPQAELNGIHRGDLIKRIANNTYVKGTVNQSNSTIIEGEVIEWSDNSSYAQKSSVLLDSIYVTESKKIGYLCYLEYSDTRDLDKPLKRFSDSGIDELILDLRYNPGGYVSTCRYLCNCIIPVSAYSQMFQQCSYNDILAKRYLEETGNERTFTYFMDQPEPGQELLGENLYPLNLSKIYVLTSKHTASASEATIICLRPYMDVIVIGEQTIGKGVGSWTISDSRFQYAIQPITMRYYNAAGETTPDEGLVPDVHVADGYSTSKKNIGDTQEPLLKVALSLISTGTYAAEPPGRSSSKFEIPLTPVGEPSYITDYKKRLHNEGI